MVESNIIFSPEIDERQLDREVGQVNEQLEGAASDIQTDFAADMDALPGGGGLADGGGGIGGAGQAAGVGALASKIPKPVAGVTASAALPIALAGGIGVSLLSEMKKSSARMQTSASLLGMAWDNIWRPIGDKVDELFIRDHVMDMVQATQAFEDAFRSSDWLVDPLIKGFADVIQLDFISATKDMTQLFVNAADQLNWGPIIPDFPGWPKVKKLWPEWPEIQQQWPKWPNIQKEWGNIGWPDVKADWANVGKWPEINPPDWPSTGQLLGKFPEISASSLRQAILGSGSDDDGDDVGGGFWPFGDGVFTGPVGPMVPQMQSGGRVQRTGVAEVHRGELVADPDRLVSELASAISGARGSTRGSSASVDTSNMERKLDRLHDDLRRLESALDVTLTVGREEIGRAASDGTRNRVTDTDPLV